MSRLFTFGCSYANWPWSTWAEIVAYDLEIPSQNWAMPGLGNVGIHSRLTECDLLHKFNKDDVILVVWSSWTREDRYDVKKRAQPERRSWSLTGDVHFTYDKQFVDNYWSMSNDLVKNSTAIISANKMFDIKFNGHISTPLTSLYNDPMLSFDKNEKLIAKFYEPHIPNDGEYSCLNGKHLCRYTKTQDSHPDVLSHLDYVREFIEPKLGKPLRKSTVDYFTEMHYTICDYTENTMDMSDGIDYRKKIESLLLTKFNRPNNSYRGF